jgi:hypothetical protein
MIESIGPFSNITISDPAQWVITPPSDPLAPVVAELLAACEELLPSLENAEADVDIWHSLTAGSGIATLNRFRAAIAKARSCRD